MESLIKPHSYLKKISGTDSGKIYPLSALVSTIGRDIHNTICLQDRFLSRKHCCIKYENPDWVLSDCGGINGTFVNGYKLPPKGTHVLRGKPIIFLGDPEESTCGFIFSPNISCPDPSKVFMPTSSSLSANPGPSSSNQEHPFSSSPIDSGDEPVLIEDGSSFTGFSQPLRTVTKHTLVGNDRSEQIERCKESIKAMRQNFTGMEQPARMRTFPCVYESGTLKPDVTRVGNRYPLYHSIGQPANPISSSVVETGDDELVVTGSSRPSGEGCSRTNPPEFNVLDMLVDSVTSDLSDDSDCSISSTDSLRTRIRKQKEKKSKTGKFLKASFGAKLSNSQKLNLPVVESGVLAVDEQQDTSYSQDSESLIHDMEDEVRDCVSEIENGDWMAVSKPMDSDALQYLKERVLKLQKTVMDASEELKKALEKNKKQEAVIEELQGKQGISQEELCEDLENELSCNICTEILIKPIILDCGHIFCEYCIAVWKKKKKQCPNCREPIRTEKEIKVLNSYLSKAVEHLEPSYCNKRKELIETRNTEVGKLKKSSRKRSQPYRVPVPANGNEPNRDIISELRVYRSFHSNRLQRNALAMQLRSLRNERPTGVRENPLLRRLVERIERNLNHEAVP